MASLSDALEALRAAVTVAVAGLPPARVYVGWPHPEELNDDLRHFVPHVSIYPAAMGDKRTNVPINNYVITEVPDVQLTATASAIQLQGGSDTGPVAATGTITFAGTVVAGTALLLKIGTAYVPFHPAANLTPAQIATAYAALINADVGASPIAQAAAVGAVLTLTAVVAGAVGNALPFWVRIGGVGVVTQKLRQQNAHIQLHIWAFDDISRALYADALDVYLTEQRFLFAASDQTPMRLLYDKTQQTDQEIRYGVYRRIVQYAVEYIQTHSTNAYTVLEGLVTVTPGA